MTTPSQRAMILYRRRCFINNLLTYLLTYNAIDEWCARLAHVCGQKTDTSSKYCDNIQPHDKRCFSFCQM